jgi:hypothetical protein
MRQPSWAPMPTHLLWQRGQKGALRAPHWLWTFCFMWQMTKCFRNFLSYLPLFAAKSISGRHLGWSSYKIQSEFWGPEQERKKHSSLNTAFVKADSSWDKTNIFIWAWTKFYNQITEWKMQRLIKRHRKMQTHQLTPSLCFSILGDHLVLIELDSSGTFLWDHHPQSCVEDMDPWTKWTCEKRKAKSNNHRKETLSIAHAT